MIPPIVPTISLPLRQRSVQIGSMHDALSLLHDCLYHLGHPDIMLFVCCALVCGAR
jgi:hypothetical protein